MEASTNELRSVIVGTLGVCLAVAMAPWFSGGQEPIAGFLTAGALLLAAGLVMIQPAVRKLSFGLLAKTYTAFVLLGVVSLVWSVNHYSTVVWVGEWVAAGLAFWIAYVLACEPKGRELVIRLYMWSAGLFSAVGVYIFMTSAYNRLTGWFYWPNPAAAYLIPAVLIATDQMRRNKGQKSWWWLAASAGLATTFLLTDSRAATIVLAVVMGVYLIIAETTKRFWIKFLFILILGLGLTVGLSEIAKSTGHHLNQLVPGSRFAEVAKGTSSSLSDRLYYLDSALKIWMAHPLVGSGAGTYQNIHPLYQGRPQSASASAHNYYVQILAELGLVGFGLVIIMLLALGGGMLRGLLKAPEMVPVVLGAAGILLHMGLDIDAQYPSLLILAAVLMGLVWSSGVKERARAGAIWPAIALVALVPAVSLYESDVWAARGLNAQNNADYETAAANYEKAVSQVTYNPTYLNAEGIDAYTVATIGGSGSKSAEQMALSLARKGIHQDPDGSQEYQLEGRALELQGNFSGAEAAFEEALHYDPYNHPDYALDLATDELIMGQPKAALRTANQMLGQYPIPVALNRSLDPTVMPNLADLFALVGNTDLSEGDLAGAERAAKQGHRYDSASIRVQALQHKLQTLNS